jgi:hypothetical protein
LSTPRVRNQPPILDGAPPNLGRVERPYGRAIKDA